jgi:hypothetical protein
MSDMASAPTACPNKSRGNRGIVPVDDKSEHWLRSIEGTHRCAGGRFRFGTSGNPAHRLSLGCTHL